MLINDEHKQKLLEIVEQHPADVALLLDYLEQELALLPSDVEGADRQTVEFFLVQSFVDEISHLRSNKKFKEAAGLLNELKELWGELFGEELEYTKSYSLHIGNKTLHAKLDSEENEMDVEATNFLKNISVAPEEKLKKAQEIHAALVNNTLSAHIDLREEITFEQLNNLLRTRCINYAESYGKSLLEVLSSPEFEIKLQAITQDDKLLAVKAFSIDGKDIFNDNFQFANAIIYLTDKFTQIGNADYSEGLTLCISNGIITSQEVLSLGEGSIASLSQY